MDDDELISEFLAECNEGLDRIEQGLVVLEATPDDTPTLTEVFRILHTIKGTCGFLGFGQLERVAHRGESLLSLLRDSVLEMDEEITDALLATTDAIVEILGVIEQTGTEGDHDNHDLIARLEALSARADHLDAPADIAEDATTVASDTDDVHAGDVDADPDEADAADDRTPTSDADADASAADPDAVADTGPSVDERERSRPPEKSSEPPKPRLGDLLVEQGAVDRIDVEMAVAEQSLGDKRPLGEILIEQGRVDRQTVESAAARQRGAADPSIRVDVSVLDSLMNLVGELVLSRNEIVQLTGSAADDGLVGPAQTLNLITSELQESVMKTRMQPIGNIWNKFPRVVRDLSQQCDKKVRLVMEGQDTELDRTILEAVKDPLTHMIRNTVDHGIETAEERIAAGKDPEGTLRLTATHEGGQVHIEIADDGKGIDADAVRRKAVEKGVVSAEAAEGMPDASVVNLVFAPGFSTAEEVSSVSGRGVGMDVVRTNIESIGGSVEVRTAIGEGTSFKIKIPLTLAIIPAIIVRCDGQRYALPQLALQELVHLGPSQRIEYVHGTPVYRLRDRLLPIVDLREQLGVAPIERADSNVVVLQADGRSFGLIVDSIADTEEIVIKPLGRSVSDSALFSGATVMGDGSVALIIDVNGIAQRSGVIETNSITVNEPDVADDDGTIDTINDQTVLVVRLADDVTVAIRLDQVDRLEEFRRDDVEVSGHREVVQYRDAIMPIVDLGPATGRSSAVIGRNESLNVVVCSIDGTSVGFAVDGIVDIVSKPDVRRAPDGGIESLVVDGRLVDLVDAHGVGRASGVVRPVTETSPSPETIGAL